MASLQKPAAAVLVLIWGDPPHVLFERKNCSELSRFSCDVALPGGRIMNYESSVDAALREAWEEVWVPPRYIKVLGSLGIFSTKSQPIIYTEAVLGRPRGPIDPRPRDPEVDAVFWVNIESIPGPHPVAHVRRGQVIGVELGHKLVLWGMTLRIVSALLARIRSGAQILDTQ